MGLVIIITGFAAHAAGLNVIVRCLTFIEEGIGLHVLGGERYSDLGSIGTAIMSIAKIAVVLGSTISVPLNGEVFMADAVVRYVIVGALCGVHDIVGVGFGSTQIAILSVNFLGGLRSLQVKERLAIPMRMEVRVCLHIADGVSFMGRETVKVVVGLVVDMAMVVGMDNIICCITVALGEAIIGEKGGSVEERAEGLTEGEDWETSLTMG